MKLQSFRKQLAFILALVMIFVQAVALAEDQNTQLVIVSDTDETDVTVDGSILVEDFSYGAVYISTNEFDASVEVKNNIENIGTEGFTDGACAVQISSYGSNSEVSVTADGTVSADAQCSGASATGVSVYGKEGSQITVETGDLSASSADHNATGIHAHTSGGDTEAKVTVDGDLSVSGGGNPGCAPVAADVLIHGGTVDINVTGSIITENGQGITIEADRMQEDADDNGNATSTVTKVTVGGDIDAESGQPSRAIWIITDDDDDTVTVDIDGSVSMENGFSGKGVDIEEKHGGNVAVSIGGDLSQSAQGGQATGISIKGEDLDASVTVGGDISAEALETGTESYMASHVTKAVTVEVSGDSNVTVTGGAVNASAEENSMGSAVAIDVTADNGSKVSVTADGDVEVSSKAHPGTSTTAVNLENGGSSIDVAISGDIIAKNGEGINIQADAESYGQTSSDTTVKVGGDIDIESGNPCRALRLSATGDGDSISAEIGGSITVNDFWNGVAVDIYGKGSMNVGIDGDVSISSEYGNAGGVRIVGSGTDAVLKISGGLSVTGKDGDNPATGLEIEQTGGSGSISVTVMDGISADNTGNNISAKAIQVDNKVNSDGGADIDISVTGDVTSTGTAIQVLGSETEGNASTKIEIKEGDVTGGTAGIDIFTDQKTDIIVDGTVSGGENAIVLESQTSINDVTLTVWKVDPGEDGNVVSRLDWKEGDPGPTAVEDEEAEKAIQYIIRLEQPAAGATLSAEGTYEYEGYQVAKESDTIILKIDLQPGYTLVKACGYTDKSISLLCDENGDYYLEVPRGGGVVLSVIVYKPGNSGQKTDKEASDTVTIVFDPNGGSIGEHTEAYSVSVSKGETIELPDTPVREGYVFLGWYGTPYAADDPAWTAPEEGSEDLLPAGASILASEDYFYTAVWKEAE